MRERTSYSIHRSADGGNYIIVDRSFTIRAEYERLFVQHSYSNYFEKADVINEKLREIFGDINFSFVPYEPGSIALGEELS